MLSLSVPAARLDLVSLPRYKSAYEGFFNESNAFRVHLNRLAATKSAELVSTVKHGVAGRGRSSRPVWWLDVEVLHDPRWTEHRGASMRAENV